MDWNQNELIKLFSPIVGENNISCKPSDLEEYGKDSTNIFVPNPSLIVFAQDTEEVSKIVQLCNTNNIKLVASGGRTGLSGGAVAAHKEVVLSLEKMNKIEWVDKINMCMKVQAGVTLEEVKNVAREHNLFFPIDTASKGSARIGGNLATNVGGLNYIKYQGMRNHVLGIEVVLADGRVLNLNRSLHKNNCGYDLKQLFIGSEGTLGIITSAILRLYAAPQKTILFCLADNSFENITKILEYINDKRIVPVALEFFSDKALNIVLSQHSHLKRPTNSPYLYYLLVELEEYASSNTSFADIVIEDLFNQNLVQEGTVATSSQEYKALWALRENISEAISRRGPVIKNDLSFPISQLNNFIHDMELFFSDDVFAQNNIDWATFGHIGDGNIHVNIFAKDTTIKDREAFMKLVSPVIEHMLQLVKKYRGSISAEHGIGLLKKNYLNVVCSDLEIELMKKLKIMFDPNNIFNPGKIFDMP